MFSVSLTKSFFVVVVLDFTFYLFDREITSRQRGRQKGGWEAGSPLSREPDVGLDPRTLRS